MPASKTIYLVRHGQTHWNRDRRLQGQRDSPLTLVGIEQARAYGRALAGELQGSGVELHVSPLPRAQQSAGIISEALGIPWDEIRHEPRLMERNQGAWDGLNAEEIERGFNPDPHLRRSWEFAAPGGESLAQLSARVVAWMDQVGSGRVVVAVCHGVVSRVMRGAHLGLSPADTIALPGHRQDRIFRLADSGLSELMCPAS
ncbi:MAG: histidine phosphatase family protein [Myxococcales bacterium]|nr:histidine phosphatase family protein [Myxococcales bacterium]MDD9968790.1 histidine phosphatase family protein [Myxococcales bacterium]